MPRESSLIHTPHHMDVKHAPRAFVLMLIRILLLLGSETDDHVIKGHCHLDPQMHFLLSQDGFTLLISNV